MFLASNVACETQLWTYTLPFLIHLSKCIEYFGVISRYSKLVTIHQFQVHLQSARKFAATSRAFFTSQEKAILVGRILNVDNVRIFEVSIPVKLVHNLRFRCSQWTLHVCDQCNKLASAV
jgi:hypothetical protein